MHGRLAFLYRASFLSAILAASVFLSASPLFAEDFDWRNVNGQNWVTSVKDQGGAGTCYDFAACGIIEAKYMLTRDDTTYQPDIAEQQSVCAGVDNGISGGHAYDVENYAKSNGIVLESELPYTQLSTSPNWPLTSWFSSWQSYVFKPTSYSSATVDYSNVAYVKNCLKAYGPLTVSCKVPGDWYNLQDQSGSGGHEVDIVGYHDDANAPGGGYWIIKNSWGATWNGDGTYSGYGEIAYSCSPWYSDYDYFHWFPQYNHDVTGINGLVYFTGAMATVNWTGGSSGAWTLGGNLWSGTDMYGHSLPTYTWDNSEAVAVFNGAGSSIPVIGPVVAHGVTISSGATNYVFNGTAGGVLTVTGGGIVAHENVTFNLSVKIGAPQTWTVDSGKSLVIGGDLHTIVSSLTINGDGDTTITGNIDGGGVLNAMGNAPGAITKTGSGTLHLTGAATYSVPLTASGVVSFEQTGANVADYASTIVGSAGVNKSNSGTIILSPASGSNTYSGWTQIYSGTVQADPGVGLPTGSALVLYGGIFQSNNGGTLTNEFWNDSPGNHCLSWFGGGFAAGGGKLTVNLYGDNRTVTWTGNGNSGIAGAIQLSSTTAQCETEFKNNLNFNGAEQTIYVADNPNSGGDFATLSGSLTGGNYTDGNGVTQYGGLIKSGPGRLVLTGAGSSYGDSYGDHGRTIISAGVLEAAPGIVPAQSCIQLDGGVFQSSGSFTRGWYYMWYNNILTWNNGGFAANGGKLTVNIVGDSRTVAWTGDGHSGIAGTMVLNSTSAQNEVEFQNPLDLTGGARVIHVDDNPDSSGDFATLSGSITDSAGGASLTKTGLGTLYLAGTTSNAYTGLTTVAGGTVVLAKTGGAIAIAGNILLSEPGDGNSTHLQLNGDNEIASTSVITFSTPVAYSHLDLNGHSQTLAGINSDPWAAIEGLWDNTGLNTDSTLTINNTADCRFQGVIRDSAAGSGSGRVILIKSGAATLVLTNNDNSFTGGVSVNGGTLQIGDGNNYGVLPTTGGAVVNSGGTLYFDRYDAYSYTGAITGAGTVKIYQGTNAVAMGTGYNTSLTGFSGTASIQSGVVYLHSANGLGSGSINMGNGANLSLWTSTTTTFSTPITLNGIGGANDGYAKPAIYGDGGSGIYTLSGQITLAATSDIGNYGGNGTMTLSGKITGAGGLVLGKAAPSLADENGTITLSGTTSNDYTGGTTINRGTVNLAKTSSAIAIPGSVTIACSATQSTGQTYLILNGSNQIASTAVMNFSGTYAVQNPYFILLGYSQTLGGINDTSGAGVIEHAESQSNITANSTLTVTTTSADCSFNGYFRDGNYGTGSTGKLTLVKNGSYKLTLSGANCGGYTGGLTVNAGTLDYSGGVLPVCSYTITGGTLNIGALSQSIGMFQINGGTVSGTGTLTSSGIYGIHSGTVNASLGGSMALSKTTSGVATLGGNNSSLSGNIVVNGGTLIGSCGFAGCAFGAGNASRTITVSSGATLSFASGDMFGGHTTTAIPTISVVGATVNSTGSGIQEEFNNITLNNGTLSAGSDAGVWAAWNINGAVTSYNTSTMNYTAGSGQIMLQSGDPTTPNTPFDVESGTLTVSCPVIDGRSGISPCNSRATNLTKTGAGTMTLSGTVADTYSGVTTVSNGKLILAKSASVVAIPGNVTINTPSSASSYLVLNASGQIATSAVMTFSPTSSYYGVFELYGNSQTLGGISDATGGGVIENTELETGVSTGGTLTISNSADCSYNGYIRNYSSGSTGLLALVKTGSNTLTLSGTNCGGYSGGLTVTGGTLDYSNGTLPGLANSVYCPYTINGGTLNIGTKTASIGTFRITSGTVNGSGTLTSNAAYDIQAGTVNAVLAGSVGLNKTNASGTATVNAPTYTGTTTVTAGTLNFTGGLPGGNYVVNGGTLNINALTKNIGTFQITSGTVNGSGMLMSNAAYSVQAGTVNAKLGGTSIGLSKTGSGLAVLNGANAYSGLTSVAGGTLELGSAAQNSVFSLGGADIKAGKLVFDYNGIASPAATIQELLTNSYDGGLWNIGQFRDSTVGTTGLTLGCFDDGSSKVTVMATYPGDFNLDGVVDSQDLNIWKANVGTGTATWQMGDANHDGVVNGLDLDLLRANVGLPQLSGGSLGENLGGEVPEPGTVALLAAGLIGLLAYAWKKRA